MKEVTDNDRVDLGGLNTSRMIRRVPTAAVVVTISGTDAGELEDAPFGKLDRQLARGNVPLRSR
jgi:hypothetical protein